MTSFDLLTVPLNGVRLIEAGAGTGKTYSIEGLFLRLLLDAGLSVDQILVLTFTVAATEELRRRIRKRLARLRNVLAGSNGPAALEDPLVAVLAEQVARPRDALRALDDALLDFDRAAIHTIHGFCQRLLTEHAFETGSLFDFELAADPAPLMMETASDFWRRHLYDAPVEVAAFFFEQQMTGPEPLVDLYSRLQRPAELTICGAPSAPPKLSRLDAFRRRFSALQSQWPDARETVTELLMTPALKVRPYGRTEETAPGGGDSPRKAKVDALCRAMDRYLHADSVGFPPFQAFSLLTAEGLAKGTRKGATPPEHPIFRTCQALAEEAAHLREELSRYLLWFKAEFVGTAAGHLADQKVRKNVLFYDDLLFRTRDALRQNRGLGRAARRRYRAALVDEFQDTDPVQYEIFTRLFRRRHSALFMIGDPKQAIYSFRGADVFSYLAAAEDAETRYSLRENWRSAPGLVEAVNALFSAAPRPFLLPGIDFAPSRPARGADDTAGEGVLEIWRVAGRPDGRPLPKSEASKRVVRRTAEEIGRLLSEGRSAAQVAVLVRTNRQAREMKSALAARKIPAVQFSAGSVFEAGEAEQLHRLLAGICDAGDIGRLRSALTTDLIGVSAAALGREEPGRDGWRQRAAPFVEDRRAWERHGFMRMFRGLMRRENIRRRLLSHPEGERRLTNLLHLAELCHRAAAEGSLGPAGLVKWLSRRRASPGAGSDEEQLRLESDARAVKVVTVHRSKGLEFQTVFVPFAWESGVLRPASERVFHDPDAGKRPTLDLGSGDWKRSDRLARTEIMAEELRLLYVAVTRAKERCVLFWGRVNQAETAALTYLLHGGSIGSSPDPAAALSLGVKPLSEAEFFAPLDGLAEKGGGGCVSVRSIEPAPGPAPQPAVQREPAPQMASRPFAGAIDRTWRVASYSLLAGAHGRTDAAEAPDRDRIFRQVRNAAAAPARAAKADILDFPGGTRAGNFFHELLEKAPFGPAGVGDRRRLAARILRRYRYDDAWLDAVCIAMERILFTPLSKTDPSLVLSSVRRAQRRHEVAFFFPLKRIDGRKLAALAADLPASFARLSFSPVQGYVKGYIDLIFRHGGRYYLLDWKSNRIGSRPADYRREALFQVMDGAHYGLQYALYSLALDRYLQCRDPDYRFETGFGGVFYLFLRGMRPEKGPEWGVFFDRPGAAALGRLREQIVAEPALGHALRT